MHFQIWLTNEQVYDTDESNDNFNDENMIELPPGTEDFNFMNMKDKRHATMILNLFDSYKNEDGTYKTEEINKAQLYMHIQADGPFKRIWNVEVY